MFSNAEGASVFANLSGKKTLVGRISGESLHTVQSIWMCDRIHLYKLR